VGLGHRRREDAGDRDLVEADEEVRDRPAILAEPSDEPVGFEVERDCLTEPAVLAGGDHLIDLGRETLASLRPDERGHVSHFVRKGKQDSWPYGEDEGGEVGQEGRQAPR